LSIQGHPQRAWTRRSRETGQKRTFVNLKKSRTMTRPQDEILSDIDQFEPGPEDDWLRR
jgi:hypothetical protein